MRLSDQRMSLSSIYLDAFLACAQHGHFTRAANHLAISQSALSQRIKNLESELAVTLFIRDRSGIRMTDAGTELLRYCRLKESFESESVRHIKNPAAAGLTGVLRVGGYSSIMKPVILPLLAPLLEQNPFIKIYFLSRELSELPVLFKNGEIDFMILDHEIEREDLVAKKIGIERSVLVQKKSYKGREVYLDHDESDQTTAQYFSKFKRKQKFERCYYDDCFGIIEAVKLGLGKAVVPFHLIKNDKNIEILDAANEMQTPVFLHHYKQDFYTKLQAAVMTRFDEYCAATSNKLR